MGYRDALIGGLLAAAALRGRDTRGWFLVSGGAVIGICVGLWGATRRPVVTERLSPASAPQ